MNTETQTIALPGKDTPDLILAQGEEVLFTLEQGIRDIGILKKLAGHKERLVITNKRVIQLIKKRRDFDLVQLNLRDANFISLKYDFDASQFIVGLLTLIIIVGLFLLFTCRRRAVVIKGASGEIAFATRSMSNENLAKLYAAALAYA